jgi:hypothetical protein
MRLLIFILWIFLNAFLVRVGVQLGWSHDPGIAGPVLLVVSATLIFGLYGTRNQSPSDSGK